ncbi:MAG TPA: hypothetical protein VKT30_15590 [Caulobacteraceae bacterium]|nr:hypothetical protein [Caulobacteraceae bacterium]
MDEEPPYSAPERLGERIYDELDETAHPHGLLSEIKECFEAAVAAAESAGAAKEAERLRMRLDHIVSAARRLFG